MVPKNNTEPIASHRTQTNWPILDIGEFAIPAVENAATPQYNASPYELIDVPSTPRSAIYITPEKICQHQIYKNINFNKGG